MDRYYYLNTSLPYLFFLKRPYLSKAEFLASAQAWLSAKEFEILKGVSWDNYQRENSDPPVLKRWKEFEYDLRKSLVIWRQAGLLEQKTPASLKDKDPLAMELELLRCRWEFLSEQEEGHFFDFEYLVIYALKLSLLEYSQKFNKEKGRENFEKLIEVKV